MVRHRQFVIKIGDVLADLRPDDLFFHMNDFQDKSFSSLVFLLLAKLDGDSLQSLSLLLVCLILRACSSQRAHACSLAILDYTVTL